jgi:putative heme-binding domain-containing protein
MPHSTASKIIFLVLAAISIGIGLTIWISSLPGISADIPDDAITVNLGEEIFWGKGTCHICHKMGERGEALRGPNLGPGKDGPVISQRAEQRAKDAGLSFAIEYITQSVAEPGVYVVPGYSSEMPEVYKPPISLTPGEMKAVIKYLAASGGRAEAAGIELPTAVFEWWQSPQDTMMEIRGSVERGRQLFFDNEGPAACASCHQAILNNGAFEGSLVGPSLTHVAAIRAAGQLYRKLVEPGERIVSGYEKVLVRTRKGILFAGVIESQDSTKVQIRLGTSELKEILREDIGQIVPQGVSAMPSNYGELLTAQELNDLLVYLQTLR